MMPRFQVFIKWFQPMAMVLTCFVLGMLLVVGSAVSVVAQDASARPTSEQGDIPSGGNDESSLAPPAGLSPELEREFGTEALLGVAPEMMAQEPGDEPPPEAALPDRYIYTSLRLIRRGSPRGCGYSDWSCLTNLCKRDLGSSAWRGWAGCHRSGSSWICYFECGMVRRTF